VLVGNPNVGKSVIFALLTGRYATVANYPGTTVTVTRGHTRVGADSVEVVDTPGVNSLTPMSEDERVTREILLEHADQSLVQVADTRNLRRALLITVQLAEMGIPFALDLNMADEAEAVGVRVDRRALSELLGIPVAQTVAVRKRGFAGLRDAIRNQSPSRVRVIYPAALEQAITDMAPLLPRCHVSARSLALMVLAGDQTILSWLRESVSENQLDTLESLRRQTHAALGEAASVIINRARLKTVDSIIDRVEARPHRYAGSTAGSLGKLATHPVWGVPMLLAVLYLMYMFVGVFGAGTAVDFFEGVIFGEFLGPWSIRTVDVMLGFPHQHAIAASGLQADYAVTGDLGQWQLVAKFFHDLLVGPYGQLTMALSYAVALILPIVATFFIAFGILEDSGYLPRLAVMVNRIFRTMGLNGKAVLPMVLGLGCDTMATLTTRVLETPKERVLVTLLLALGVPCSAQLGVILAMMGALSPAATLVWIGSVMVTLFAVGWIAARVIPGQCSDFLVELPPIRMPQLGNILVKTMARIEWYLREAVPLFLLGTLVLFLLDTFRLLGAVERAAAPLVQGLLGLPAQAAEAFLVGFLRRDYGAAGLFNLAREGVMDPVQLVVAMVTITLFVPCIANFLIMIKERGARTALLMVAVILPTAFLVGGSLNFALRALEVTF
jgi:ferrous iron transport protein B